MSREMRVKIFHAGLVSTLLCAFAVACSAGEVLSEQAAAKAVGKAIDRYKLSLLKDECLSLQLVQHRAWFDVNVQERHTPACGGDNATAPRLFTIRVRKEDGALTSDVYDHVEFKRLDHSMNLTDK